MQNLKKINVKFTLTLLVATCIVNPPLQSPARSMAGVGAAEGGYGKVAYESKTEKYHLCTEPNEPVTHDTILGAILISHHFDCHINGKVIPSLQ